MFLRQSIIEVFFFLSGDEALDLDELDNYIQTLMSLPSKQETEVKPEDAQNMWYKK